MKHQSSQVDSCGPLDIILSDEMENVFSDERKTEKSNQGYHPLFLQQGAIQFMTPVRFEDGMDWGECELYYTMRSEGSNEPRSSYHKKGLTHKRGLSKRQLQQLCKGELPTCLRSHAKQSFESRRLPMRRSVSFSGLPRNTELYSQCFGAIIPALRDGPHVSFVDYVEIVTITPFKEYPENIQDTLRMSRIELKRVVRNAMMQAMTRRKDKDRKQRREKLAANFYNANDQEVSS
jgi:hypothetical protein